MSRIETMSSAPLRLTPYERTALIGTGSLEVNQKTQEEVLHIVGDEDASSEELQEVIKGETRTYLIAKIAEFFFHDKRIFVAIQQGESGEWNMKDKGFECAVEIYDDELAYKIRESQIKDAGSGIGQDDDIVLLFLDKGYINDKFLPALNTTMERVPQGKSTHDEYIRKSIYALWKTNKKLFMELDLGLSAPKQSTLFSNQVLGKLNERIDNPPKIKKKR